MRRLLAIIFTLVALCTLPQPAAAEPPESAHIDVTNPHGPLGICYVSSLGQLIMQRNPSIAMYDVVAMSGIGTGASWGRGGTPYPYLAGSPRGYSQGPQVDVARLTGAGYRVCYGKGGACGRGMLAASEGATVFKSEAEAVNTLKTLLAAGTPVQVHIDIYYVWDELSPVDPMWPPGGKSHGSHSIVVNGYDADHVYLTDNGPLGAHGETGENLPVSWAAFLTAWRETPKLTWDRNLWFGPYFMCYLTSGPVTCDRDWIAAWLGLDAVRPTPGLPVGPAAIRAAAAALRAGRSSDTVASLFTIGTLTQCRTWVVPFFENAGHADIADLYRQSAALWDLLGANPNDPLAAGRLDEIANVEEEALSKMAALAQGVDHVRLLAPLDTTNLTELDSVMFRWAALPDVKGVTVHLAMTDDFADSKKRGTVRPKAGCWFAAMTVRDWRKLLPKDDGDRGLSWRATTAGPAGPAASATRTLTWDVQSMTAAAPEGGHIAAQGELVSFAWEAPAVALRPRVAISTIAGFGDPKRIIYLSPAKGASEAAFKAGTAALLVKKDDGDRIVYWRAEDAAGLRRCSLRRRGRSRCREMQDAPRLLRDIHAGIHSAATAAGCTPGGARSG